MPNNTPTALVAPPGVPRPVGAIAPAYAVVSDWIDELSHEMTPEPLLEAAGRAANQLSAQPYALIALSPGNGYTYLLVLTRLPEIAFGGNLMVALPEFHRCLLLNFIGRGYHVPGYVEEKLGLGKQHAAVLAGFLTLLDAFEVVT